MTTLSVEGAVVETFLRALHGDPMGFFEVRVPKLPDRPGSKFVSTSAGYFQSHRIDQAVTAIAAIDGLGYAPAIYVTLNPVNPDLLARSANRIKSKATETTSDGDVVGRRRILIDMDPIRAAGISSTDAELALAEAKAQTVSEFLSARGWPNPIRVMSGNGHHLIYGVDLPAQDDGLVERVLKALADRFNDAGVAVDRSVSNASRITKVAGTMSRKGEHLVGVEGVADRPHRRAELLSAPEPLEDVSRELLESLVRDISVPADPPRKQPALQPRAIAKAGRFDQFEHTAAGVRGYLERHGVSVRREIRKDISTLILLDRCLIVPECTSTGDSDIAVMVGDEGVIAYKNLHSRGVGLGWVDVRDTLEPGYRAHAERCARSRQTAAGITLEAIAVEKDGRLVVSARDGTGTEIERDKVDTNSSRSRGTFAGMLKEKAGLSDEDASKLDGLLRSLEPPLTAEEHSGLTDRAEMLAKADETRAAALAATPAHILRAAEDLLSDPSLIDQIHAQLKAAGVVGEDVLALILYLAGTSRLLSRPLSAIVQGTSSSGKSFVIERVAQHFPDECVLKATDMTPNSLFYLEPGRLLHCFVVAGERSRVESDERAEGKRALREMISACELRKIIPIKRGNEMVTVELYRPGPIAFVESTTTTRLFDEDANRCLLASTDETPEQTSRIIHAAAQRAQWGPSMDGDERLAVHHALQRLLRRVTVNIPFAGKLAASFPSQRPEARRAFEQLLGMIRAVALLHQRQRARGDIADGDIIEATIDDYVVARRLIEGPLGRSMGGAMPDPVARFGERLSQHAGGTVFTSTEVDDPIVTAKSKVNQYLRSLMDVGVVECVEEGRGNKPARWKFIGTPPKAGAAWLPTLEVLVDGEVA